MIEVEINETYDELAIAAAKIRASNLVDDYASSLNDALKYCESPIEKELMIAIEIVARENCEAEAICYKCQNSSGLHAFYGDIGDTTYTKLTIEPQKRFDQYRVDFFLTFSEFGPHPKYELNEDGEVKSVFYISELIVECDGHDYHERTKEQAARDKKRDRAIQSMGYKIFRFTGSEIRRDPIDCAQQIVKELQKLTDKYVQSPRL